MSLEKIFTKKQFIVKFYAHSPCEILELVSAEMCSLVDIFSLSTLTREMRKTQLQSEQQLWCYHCRHHQRNPRVEEDAVCIWKFKSTPLNSVSSYLYTSSSWCNRWNRCRIVDSVVICEFSHFFGGGKAVPVVWLYFKTQQVWHVLTSLRCVSSLCLKVSELQLSGYRTASSVHVCVYMCKTPGGCSNSDWI